jgi:uncharacterized SAM-binding protein YcdF (DUF218 family)
MGRIRHFIILSHALSRWLIIAVVLFLPVSFLMRSHGTAGNALPRTAIVFTGQFDRVHLGLRLLEESRIDRLFISGVNAGAGIDPKTFAEQFELSPRLQQALRSGAITLAPKAQTTVENGYETACWLRKTPDVRSVTLITSQRHMARAYLALKRLRPGRVKIIRLPVPETSAERLDIQSREFLAYSATWALLLIPGPVRPDGGNPFC